MPAPVLVFGIGNPSRGDDALGPAFVEAVAAALGDAHPEVECLTDFQWQVEHALDLAGRAHVLLVDASATGPAPFALTLVHAADDWTHTSHALSPAALLQVTQRLVGTAPPATLLAIRGNGFELGAPISAAAAEHLQAAVRAALPVITAAGAVSAPA